MWKNAKIGCPMPMAVTISPNWLVVEYAMIFFMSCWATAVEAANKAVTPPRSRTIDWALGELENSSLVRTKINTPATTIVDLWRRADTGVGPSIAAGSHGWSPNWADFPAAARTNPNSINVRKWLGLKLRERISSRSQDLNLYAERAINMISPISPIRLYITASSAALLASFRVAHQLIKRKDKNPTPSHPKNIRNNLFEEVSINIFSRNIVNSRKKAFFLGSSSM